MAAGAAPTRTPFVGRDDELRTLRALLDAPVGQVTVVLVAGEPGIGKSRLITECLRDRARQVLATGSGDIALRELRARYGAGAAPVDWLADAVTEPGVLVLDDLHRADPATVEFVRACVVRPPDVPLVVVGGYRPASAAPALLATVADGVACSTVTEIVLGPLPDAALAELSGCPEERTVFATCGGNPRWAQLAVGRAAVEVTVRAELARLPTTHLALLRALAVFGGEADLALLAAVCAAGDGAALGGRLGALTETGLVVYDERSAHARFRHPRIRELVYAGLDPVAKADAHHAAARARQAVGAPVEDCVAHLEHLCGNLDAHEARMLLDAARRVLRRAPATAARWLDLALRVSPDRWPPEADRTGARLLLGRAQVLAGDLLAGRATLHGVLADVAALPPDLRGQAAVAASLAERLLGRFREASQLLARAARWSPDTTPALSVTVERGVIALLDNSYPDLADHVEDVARGSGSAPARDRAAVLAVAALGAASRMDIDRAAGYLDDAVALVDAAPDVALGDSVETLAHLAAAEVHLERFTDARRHLRRGITLAEDTGAQALLPSLLFGQTQALLWTRSLPAAQASCDRALALAGACGSEASRSCALALRAQLLTWSSAFGAADGAVGVAEEAVACANHRTLWGQTAVAVLAGAQLMAGQPEQCVATFLALAGGAGLTEVAPVHRTRWYRMMTGASVLAGDIAGARDFAARAAAHADERLASHRALRAAAAADLLAACGRLDEALPRYRLAVDEFSACEWALHRDWSLATMGTVLAACGRPAEALDWLRRGRAGARRCGVRATVTLADSALGRIDPTAVRESPLGLLTPRQREIVRLVLGANSNRDIAELLSLSVRTVESHVANAYRAMGVSSRVELSAMVAGQRTWLPGEHHPAAGLSLV